MIHSDLIYQTKLGSIIKVLEEKYGYNDYVNLVFFLLNEMSNPESQWKPYLDLLPRRPASIAFKYWERKSWIEDELLHVPILSNTLLI
jgi:hypothetical protein